MMMRSLQEVINPGFVQVVVSRHLFVVSLQLLPLFRLLILHVSAAASTASTGGSPGKLCALWCEIPAAGIIYVL